MMAFLRIAVAALALACFAGPLTACGKSGPPKLPGGKDDGYPHQYPRQ